MSSLFFSLLPSLLPSLLLSPLSSSLLSPLSSSLLLSPISAASPSPSSSSPTSVSAHLRSLSLKFLPPYYHLCCSSATCLLVTPLHRSATGPAPHRGTRTLRLASCATSNFSPTQHIRIDESALLCMRLNDLPDVLKKLRCLTANEFECSSIQTPLQTTCHFGAPTRHTVKPYHAVPWLKPDERM